MPLEDLEGPDKYLNALNRSWPLDDDPRPEGDNHIRGFKNVILNTFGALSAPFEALRAVLWNTPAVGQPQETGSLRTAVGTTAQRPASPTTGDERWNTDIRPEGWQPEQFYQGAWKHRIMCVDLENFMERSQYINSRQDTVPPGNEYGVFWGPSDDNAERMVSIRGRSISDASGNGQMRLGLRLYDTFNDCLTIDRVDGVAFFNVPALTVNGVEPVYQGFESTKEDFALGQTLAFAHGLGARPKMVQAYIVAKETAHGYPSGTELPFNNNTATQDTQNNFDNAMSSVFVDNDTEVKVQISSVGVALPRNGSGNFGRVNPAQWQIQVRAWL